MAFSMKSCSTSNSSITKWDLCIKAALFHSTPVLERRRKWDSAGGGYRDSAKSWRGNEGFNDPFSSKGTSWFRGQDWAKGKKRNKYGSQGPQWGNHKSKGEFHFCFGDDEDVEVIFRSAFGVERGTYWSFIHDDSSQWRSSSYTKNRKKWKWSSRYEDEYETYKDYNDGSQSNLASDRLALGLSASGPLKLEDVKNAYRTCALKWHPDRHQGSSKAEAEEKFKLCSAAYQSLCVKLE